MPDERNRFDVRSRDGTRIAVWVEGRGPPLVMVHGSIADHTTFEPFVEDGLSLVPVSLSAQEV